DQGAWDRATQGIISRNQPYIDKDLASLEHRLSNQGINMGSEAWNDEMRRNSAAVNDFRMAADNAGLGQAMSLYGQQASARDKAINEMMQQRTQPLNELAAMLSGSQVQGPSFIGTPQSQVNPADIMGATYAGYNTASNNYNAGANRANATNNAMMGGLFGLGSAGIGAYFG
ncbi:MAG: hypothetical protein OEY89_02390, partial [Gammaproteobacteria bacterium]|nr:hypothetical protein [Gammaproteobacteria bacterium]